MTKTNQKLSYIHEGKITFQTEGDILLNQEKPIKSKTVESITETAVSYSCFHFKFDSDPLSLEIKL